MAVSKNEVDMRGQFSNQFFEDINKHHTSLFKAVSISQAAIANRFVIVFVFFKKNSLSFFNFLKRIFY